MYFDTGLDGAMGLTVFDPRATETSFRLRFSGNEANGVSIARMSTLCFVTDNNCQMPHVRLSTYRRGAENLARPASEMDDGKTR